MKRNGSSLMTLLNGNKMQKIIIVNVKYGRVLTDEVSSLLEDGWSVVSTTPILQENDGASYTTSVMFVLQTDYYTANKWGEEDA